MSLITSDNLRKVRQVYRMSQAEIGSLADVSAAYINQVERGNRKLSDRVSEALTSELGLTAEKLRSVLMLYDEIGERESAARLPVSRRLFQRINIV